MLEEIFLGIMTVRIAARLTIDACAFTLMLSVMEHEIEVANAGHCLLIRLRRGESRLVSYM